MVQDDRDAIIEAFRSASVGVAGWTPAIEALSSAMGGRIGQISAVDRSGNFLINLLSGTSPDEDAAYFEAGGPDPLRNPRTRAVLAATPMRCITEEDFATAETANSAIYTGLFRQSDVPSCYLLRIDPSPDLLAAVAILRPRSSGARDPAQVRLMESVAPMLAVALQTGLQLGTAADEELLQTAEHLAGPAMLLGHDLALVSLSPSAESHLRSGGYMRLYRGKICAAHPHSTTALDAAFRAVTGYGSGRRGKVTVSLRSAWNLPPVLVDLCPLPLRMSGPLSRARALLTVQSPREPDMAIALVALRNAYGFTPAEVAVTMMLASGVDLPTIARRRGTTVATVRSQTKSLLEKTGTTRQAELVAKLRPFC